MKEIYTYWNTIPNEATFAQEQINDNKITYRDLQPLHHMTQLRCILPDSNSIVHQVTVHLAEDSKWLYCSSRFLSQNMIGRQVVVLLFNAYKLLYCCLMSQSCCTVGQEVSVLLIMATTSPSPYAVGRGFQFDVPLFEVPKWLFVGQGLKMLAKLLYIWLISPMPCTLGQGLYVAVLLFKVFKSLYGWLASCCTDGQCLQFTILLFEVLKWLCCWS